MLAAKLWHNKTETKSVKVAKMVEFIKTRDQYPCRFNFGTFFNSIIPHSLLLGKNRSLGNAVWEEWIVSFCLRGNDENLGESFGGMSKNEQVQFFDSQMYLCICQ